MAAARRKAKGKMSDEEKTSRRLLRMEARKEEATERKKRKEAEMEKLMAFLARERAKATLKDKGWKIKKRLARRDKRKEEATRDAGKGVKRRRREAG